MTPAQPLNSALERRLEEFSGQNLTQARELGPEAEWFVRTATTTLHGGKRLRARFCANGWRAVAPGSAGLPPALLDACAALEAFQAAALVHDDLIDNSDTRRGRPSSHRIVESGHRDRAWSGDAEGFGRSSAILLGDLLLAWSAELFDEALAATGEASSAVRARAEYALMRREVMIGQFLDVVEESAWSSVADDEHADRALRVASLKSARYSVQQPLVIGAALAGGAEPQLAALRAFGHPLGLAFQLRDDVLGVFGDASETGKPAGDDLREGKRTLLVAYAREAADERSRARLDTALGDVGLPEDEIADLRRLITRTGALERVETLISAYASQARDALVDAPLDAQAMDELRTLITVTVDRRS